MIYNFNMKIDSDERWLRDESTVFLPIHQHRSHNFYTSPATAHTQFEAGSQIIRMGDDGDYLFVIEEGKLECYKDIEGVSTVVKTCEAGDVFGELALLYNTTRAANVRACSKCTLWQLDRETFNAIVKDAAASKRARYESFLKQVPLLKNMTSYELSQVRPMKRLRCIRFAYSIFYF